MVPDFETTCCQYAVTNSIKALKASDHIQLLIRAVPDFSRGSSSVNIRPFLANLAAVKFLAGFGRFSKIAVHVDYLELKGMKLVLNCQHLSDMMVWHTLSRSALNKTMILHD